MSNKKQHMKVLQSHKKELISLCLSICPSVWKICQTSSDIILVNYFIQNLINNINNEWMELSCKYIQFISIIVFTCCTWSQSRTIQFVNHHVTFGFKGIPKVILKTSTFQKGDILQQYKLWKFFNWLDFCISSLRS